ncbi:MAG: hypothetical protein A2798_01520 [Candidatus Levybacteria bacterium RIFCSPHIGHO2_01_FULL_37_17]|nr:MAG: hypothetical protein A2798_01520 [Candidatus Levybacteria bacterium RIFCSPHIGHO2_01_FULL_37_17]OGH37128.1 MAG: hypothetical protein A2959_02380 [Candidatus Levybacteria bacterium RIFCSPLOWO2_01_FULL_38_23]
MKPVKDEANWDKKKIFIFFSVLILILLFLSYRLVQFNTSEPAELPNSQIKGISADDLSKNVKETISNLQKQAENLDIEEVATSSPQVQKIINDLKSLKDVPKNELKNTCERICNGL